MGLDYDISVKITERATNDTHIIEIAYWRKCWALRT